MDILDTTIANNVLRSVVAWAGMRHVPSVIREEEGRVTVVPWSALPA